MEYDDTMEYDKTYAVFSATNQPDYDEGSQTDNLIHESGRIQLNTYQAFIRDFMNPQSSLRSLLLVHMTGTGKTITALATATEYVKQYDPNNEHSSIASIVVLGFTKDIFKKELLSHPEFAFVNLEEAKQLKELEQKAHESSVIAEQYASKRTGYQKRLTKREVRGIYQFYGYRQFAHKLINMDDVRSMLKKQTTEDLNELEFDTVLLKKWIDSGSVRINENFIKSLARSLFICDEVHNLYKMDMFNTYGLAIQMVFDYYFKKLEYNDINYGSVRSLMLSATPLTSTALEIIPITTLLTGDTLKRTDVFTTVDGVDQLTPSGSTKVRQSLAGRISYIMDDNPKEYPSSAFEGVSIKGIDYLKFIRTEPTGHQLNCFKHWEQRDTMLEERGSSMIKDIVLPSTKATPHGVTYSKNIPDLADLPSHLAVHKSQAGLYSSEIFKLKELSKYSCKYAKLLDMCISMKGTEHGKIFVYHPYVQGSGTDMLVSAFIANGFVLAGDEPSKDSMCMHCDKQYSQHGSIKDHEYSAVHITYVTGSISKSAVSSRLNAFNNDQNIYGERIKIIIGSKAMRESHTLKACRHVMIAHEPSSISEMIQIIGRAVRKHVHSMLPLQMRSVSVYVLTTNVSAIKAAATDPVADEEEAYRIKVLQYGQIDKVERIMYDISVDYLINFRFKLRETPTLLGETYSLDKNAYSTYEKALTRAYKDLRNGTALTGIHTNRFNIFHFDGEVRLVMIIIKRIILDHQPAISIGQLKELIREPPFHIEYNTKLISTEAIVVAINKLVFKREQIRLIRPVEDIKLADALFDQSSTLIDSHGREYKIVCFGNTLCSDSLLTKQLLTSLMEGDNSIIDAYRRLYTASVNDPIDLKQISEQWASTIDVNDIIEDLLQEHTTKGKESLMTKLPNATHALLAEWAIEEALKYATSKGKADLVLLQYLVDYYRYTRLLIIVSDLEHTRIYDRYKKLNVNNGSSWYSTNTKPSTASLPIGHMIEGTIRVIDLHDRSWMELVSIGEGLQPKHPNGFYIYEERIGKTLSVALKIRFESDAKAKGITLGFLPITELERIARLLNVSLRKESIKKDFIDLIEKAAWKAQSKLYPKRIIYRLVDL